MNLSKLAPLTAPPVQAAPAPEHPLVPPLPLVQAAVMRAVRSFSFEKCEEVIVTAPESWYETFEWDFADPVYEHFTGSNVEVTLDEFDEYTDPIEARFDDEFTVSAVGEEWESETFYVPPAGLTPAQVELYVTLRRDGTGQQDAAGLALLAG